MLRFLFHVSIALCFLPQIGCSNDSSTATAVFSLNSLDFLAPMIESPTVEEKVQQLERYASLARGYRVMHAALNKPGINELKCVKQAVKTNDPESWLAERTTVEVIPAEEVLVLNVSSSTPEQALALCGAVTDAFKTEVVNDERTEQLKKIDRIKVSYSQKVEELRIGREDLNEMNDLHAYETDNPINQLHGDLYTAMGKRITQLRLENEELKAEIAFIEKEFQEAPSDNKNLEKKDSAHHEAIDRIRRQIAQNQAKERILIEKYFAMASEIKRNSSNQYFFELEWKRNELNTTTRIAEELGQILERLQFQIRVTASPLSLRVPPHVPGFEPDD